MIHQISISTIKRWIILFIIKFQLDDFVAWNANRKDFQVKHVYLWNVSEQSKKVNERCLSELSYSFGEPLCGDASRYNIRAFYSLFKLWTRSFGLLLIAFHCHKNIKRWQKFLKDAYELKAFIQMHILHANFMEENITQNPIIFESFTKH